MGATLSRICHVPITPYHRANPARGSAEENGYQKKDDEESADSVVNYTPPDSLTVAIQVLLDDAKSLQAGAVKDAAKHKQKMAMTAKKLTGQLLGPEAVIGGMAVQVRPQSNNKEEGKKPFNVSRGPQNLTPYAADGRAWSYIPVHGVEALRSYPG